MKLRVWVVTLFASLPLTAAAEGAQADLVVSASHRYAVAPAGGLQYLRVEVRNNGPVSTRARVDVPVRANSQTQWTCTAIGAARCGAVSGTTTIAETVTLPPASSVQFDAVYSTDPCWRVTADWTDTATVTALDATDPVLENNRATAAVTAYSAPNNLGPTDAAVIILDDTETIAPGATTTYTITAINKTTWCSKNFTVTAPLPAQLSAGRWTCTAEGGARCGAASGTGGLRDVAVLTPNPGRLVYKLTATAATTLTTGERIAVMASGTHQEGTTPYRWAGADYNRVAAGVDCSPARPSVATLWPANHELVPVSVTGLSVPARFTSIRQDEAPLATGSGQTSVDGFIQPDGTVTVRAERSGNGDGRVYHLGFTATAPSGATCQGTLKVCVPKAQGQSCTDGGATYESGGATAVVKKTPPPQAMPVRPEDMKPVVKPIARPIAKPVAKPVTK